MHRDALWFTTPVEWIVGGMMVASGLVGVFHLVVGVLASLGMWRRSPADSDLEPRRGSLSSASVAERGPVWAVVLMQLLLGGALLGWPKQISPFLSLILMLAVAAEGAIILWLSFHFQGLATKISLWVAGGLSVAVAVAALYSWGSPNADHLVGTLIGVKLIMIGAIFFRIGWGASESDLRSAYVGLSSFQEEPTTGSIYAVYYGPAFHCGISIGDGYIVDYLTDGIVRCISWEEFLLGRRAMEWNYPDVAAGSSEEISRFAKSLVGKFNHTTRFDSIAKIWRSTAAVSVRRPTPDFLKPQWGSSLCANVRFWGPWYNCLIAALPGFFMVREARLERRSDLG